MEILSLPQYDIFVGSISDTFQQISIQQYTQIVVICDENTQVYCLPLLKNVLQHQSIHIIQIKSGEQHKNIATCEYIWGKMLALGVDRKALVINLGGGVIGDMGGFCAATFKRGVDFIQIPTTLLSQVDSSIGGKLGIDFQGVKNSIGVFQDPKIVLIDTFFFKTLSLREQRSGFAEIIKHALIEDEALFTTIFEIKTLDNIDWNPFIVPSLHIKKNIVEQDPFEKNVRKALNFGHTVGHAVESYFLDTPNPLLHGEAIAIGMVCEAFLSWKKGFLSKEELGKITTYFIHLYGKIKIPNDCYDTLLATMQQDKKNETSDINFTFLKKIGQFQINQTANHVLIKESLDFYNQI